MQIYASNAQVHSMVRIEWDYAFQKVECAGIQVARLFPWSFYL